jgi:hypothetical protein
MLLILEAPFIQTIDHVTGTTPSSVFNPNAFHTATDPSTILLRQGGWYACSASQPFTESHSSTTFAVVLFPFCALILINFPHLEPPLYHPVDNATTLSVLLWYWPSHSEAPPPSPPNKDSSKFIRISWISFKLITIYLWLVDNSLYLSL